MTCLETQSKKGPLFLLGALIQKHFLFTTGQSFFLKPANQSGPPLPPPLLPSFSCSLSAQRRASVGWLPHQGLTCFCSLHFSHHFLHARHISILDGKDKVLLTTHADDWA